MKKITVTLDEKTIAYLQRSKEQFGTPYSVTIRRALESLEALVTTKKID